MIEGEKRKAMLDVLDGKNGWGSMLHTWIRSDFELDLFYIRKTNDKAYI